MALLKFCFSAAFFITSIIVLLRAFFLHIYPDFNTFYYAPLALIGGTNPYYPGENYTEFLYPPITLLLLQPLSFLPYEISAKVWLFVSIVMLVAAVILVMRLYGKKLLTAESLILFGLVFSAFPVKFTLGMGQINHLILLLSVTSIYFYVKKRSPLAGVFMGILFSIKLYPLLLGLYFLLKKEWRIISPVIITMIIGAGLALLVFPFEINEHFYTTVLPNLGISWKSDYYNQALSGFLIRIVNEKNSVHILQVLISLFMLGVTVAASLINRKKTESAVLLEIGSFIVLSILINNFSWQHHFVLLMLPFLSVYYFISQKKLSFVWYISIIVSYILVAVNLRQPDSVPAILQANQFFGAVILWCMSILLLKKHA